MSAPDNDSPSLWFRLLKCAIAAAAAPLILVLLLASCWDYIPRGYQHEIAARLVANGLHDFTETRRGFSERWLAESVGKSDQELIAAVGYPYRVLGDFFCVLIEPAHEVILHYNSGMQVIPMEFDSAGVPRTTGPVTLRSVLDVPAGVSLVDLLNELRTRRDEVIGVTGDPFAHEPDRRESWLYSIPSWDDEYWSTTGAHIDEHGNVAATW